LGPDGVQNEISRGEGREILTAPLGEEKKKGRAKNTVTHEKRRGTRGGGSMLQWVLAREKNRFRRREGKTQPNGRAGNGKKKRILLGKD